jgi:hypothetical protein
LPKVTNVTIYKYFHTLFSFNILRKEIRKAIPAVLFFIITSISKRYGNVIKLVQAYHILYPARNIIKQRSERNI